MESDASAAITRPLPSGRSGLGPSALMPRSAGLHPAARWLLYLCVIALAGAALLDLAHLIFNVEPSWEDALHAQVVVGANALASALIIWRALITRRDRLIWALLASAFASYSVGTTLWNCWIQYWNSPPSPSLADVFWLASYPMLALALLHWARRSTRRRARGRILVDGLLSAAAAAAVCAAFIAPPLIRAAQRDHAAVVTDLMYPVADMLIGALAFAALSVRGWRLDRRWALVTAALALWLLGDCAWAVEISGNAATGNSASTVCYLFGCTLAAIAAWQPDGSRIVDQEAARRIVAPAVLALVPPAILLYDHFSRISLPALILTWIALLAAVWRIALTMRDAMVLRDAQRAALTDELTGLPNRRMFRMQLQQRLALTREGHGSLTAMMLDLDNFKQLNDTLGHDAGDELLRLTGPRLVRAAGQRSVVARLGGDEFAILLPPDCSRAEACAVAKAVLDAFNEPLKVYGLGLRLTASAGIATYPGDAEDPDNLLKCADIAMYEAKRSRHGWEFYSAKNDVNTRERLQMTGELAEALEGEEIEVAFQAIADAGSRLIRSAEALVRWRRADGSLRPPDEFLEAAELAGLSRQLTRRVLKLALDNLVQWRAAGHIISVSVNTTVTDLLDEAFPAEIAEALSSRGLRGEALKIEVTESSIMADPARVSAVLDRLRALGVKIALDDFGTGYSSLTHLRELPVDRLKVDRSFVTHMRCEPTDAAIVYATIELAHKLNMKVIAEGVEDEATWQALIELECDAIQGYVLNKPTDPADFRALLDSVGSTPAADREDYVAPGAGLLGR